MSFRKLEVVRYIVVHCSATPPELDWGADEIRLAHMRDNGWADIGYHRVYRRDGRVEDGRPLDVQGAGVRGYNHESIHLCLVGGVKSKGDQSVGFKKKDIPEANYTLEQMKALAADLYSLQMKFPRAKVVGHRDLPGVAKACPCFDVPEWYARVWAGDFHLPETLP